MATFVDPGADLSVRETILGMMKTRDALGTGKIHTSDFRSLTNDLGYPLGHRVVENILVHCVISSEGLIDFSGVERELARERRLMSTHVNKEDFVRQVTSFSTPAHPWRADVVHEQKMQSERQAKLLQEFQRSVSDEFQLFAGGKRSEEDFVNYIKSLGITPTKSFLELLRKNRSTDIQYSEFMRSLINYDPSNRMIDTSQPAGGAPNLMVSDRNGQREEITAGLFYSRKRLDIKKKIEMRIGSSEPVKSGRRLVANVSTADAHAAAPGGLHQFFKNSRQVQSLISDPSEPMNMLSTAQIDMRRGQLGKDSRGVENISYSSEQRILREQVLAALRKMDAGELSTVEFQDKMFTMGVELPQVVLRELQQYMQSGLLNWSSCVQAIDAYVFKHKSIMDMDEGADEESDKYRLQMIAAIRAKGPSGFTELQAMFKDMDEDGSNALSYGEFYKGCQKFQLEGMTTDMYRVIFNSFDKSGDGMLSFEEFIRVLRGDLSRKRLAILYTAFRKLDRNGVHAINIDTFLGGYDPTNHPDVMSGRKTENNVLNGAIQAFQVKVIYGKKIVIVTCVLHLCPLSVPSNL
jgi:Ca2+-binding EF-hand superfamily protein